MSLPYISAAPLQVRGPAIQICQPPIRSPYCDVTTIDAFRSYRGREFSKMTGVADVRSHLLVTEPVGAKCNKNILFPRWDKSHFGWVC